MDMSGKKSDATLAAELEQDVSAQALEFAMWFTGASEMAGETPPSQEQWDRIRERVSRVAAAVTKSKLLGEGHRALVRQELEQRRIDAARDRVLEDMRYRTVAHQMNEAEEKMRLAQQAKSPRRHSWDALGTITSDTGLLRGKRI